MNPPYGKHISDWMKKAYHESLKGATVVCLVHSRTDTRWFHNWVYGKAEIRFVKGRLKFGDGKGSAPFPSMIAIYKAERGWQ
jgi:site-specific DNA-methyltransferase (adenine-specific)